MGNAPYTDGGPTLTTFLILKGWWTGKGGREILLVAKPLNLNRYGVYRDNMGPILGPICIYIFLYAFLLATRGYISTGFCLKSFLTKS